MLVFGSGPAEQPGEIERLRCCCGDMRGHNVYLTPYIDLKLNERHTLSTNGLWQPKKSESSPRNVPTPALDPSKDAFSRWDFLALVTAFYRFHL